MRSRRRLLLWAAGLFLAAPGFTQQKAEPKVLFVCEHGAAKSIIAAAHFNKLAEERGLPHRALARGTHPDPTFSPTAVSGLKAEGLAAPEGRPGLVTDKDVSGAERIVTLGCKLPYKTAATDWADVPSPSENYGAASKAIHEHVKELINELSSKENQPKR